MVLFLALCFLGVAIGGATALVIFWPLALVHIRDRHPQLGAELGPNAFFRPQAWMWRLPRHARSKPQRPRHAGARLAVHGARRPARRLAVVARLLLDARMTVRDEWWLASAGNTLIWEQNGLVMRVEAQVDKATALRIAASFR